MMTLDMMLREACAVQRTAELKVLDGLGKDSAEISFSVQENAGIRRGKKVGVALLAACLLFGTTVCAFWPTVSVQIQQGKAYLMADNAGTGSAAFERFTFSDLPADCEIQWNQAEGYYSCTVRRGTEKFTVVQYPLEHRAQIIGDEAEGNVTQNDLEGIQQDFCTVSNVEELTDTMLESYSVVSWATDHCYFVSLNDTWTDFSSMKEILQEIQS